MRVTAVIVARGGSKRLPNKALLPFGASSLVAHKVGQLRLCRFIDEVIVGSDSVEILDAAQRAGATVVSRDAFHCDEDYCSANQMIGDMVRKVSAVASDDLIVWAHPTNPLVQPDTYDRAVLTFKAVAAAGSHDSLCSVTRVQRHAWHDNKPFNFDPFAVVHQTAAQLSVIEFQDGAIFIQPREQMLRNSYFYGNRPLLFPIPAVEGWDIDTRQDYDAAVALSHLEAVC